MPEYFVETEHIRGERRVYWVAKKAETGLYRAARPIQVTEVTTSKRKAERDCDALNSSVTNGDRA